MRYRPLDANGDYTINRPFLANSPAAVAQLVLTRLLLFLGEWFANTADGTPYATQVLGTNTQATRDMAIRQRILDTENVVAIDTYSSDFNPVTRAFTVSATLDTSFGQAIISTSLPSGPFPSS